MRSFLIVIVLLMVFSCKNNKSGGLISDDLKTVKYTFSIPYDVNFNVCGSTYSVIYKYSHAIDTALLYSGIFFMGPDSLIYVQIRSTSEELNNRGPNNSQYHEIMGDVTQLTLYDGKKARSVKPPFFDPFFSAFTLENNDLYYWGLSEDSTFACKYNIRSRELKKIFLTNLNWGTDNIGVFECPHIYNNHVVEFYSDLTDRWWIIDPDFDKILNFKLNKEDTIPF